MLRIDIDQGVAPSDATPSTATGTKGSSSGPPDVGSSLGGLEAAAKWLSAGFALVTVAVTAAGASTTQLARMASAFPSQVAAIYLTALSATVLAGLGWALRGAGEIPSWKIPLALLAFAIWGPWALLRLPAGPSLHWWWFPLVLSAVTLLIVINRSRPGLSVAGLTVIGSLLLFSLAVAGAIQVGVSALKMYTSAFVSPSVAVEGHWATVSTSLKVTGLPIMGGVRLYLVDSSDPNTVFGASYVAADVEGTVNTVVPMRVPANQSKVEVRLTRCASSRQGGDETINCAAPSPTLATPYSQVSIAGSTTAASLTAAIAPTADGKVTLTVAGVGLWQVVTVEYGSNGPGNSLRATVRPDDNGAVSWTAVVGRLSRGVSLKAAAGATKAEATYTP